MTHTVFYSWQSDLPNNTNRSFILDALEKAAKTIRQDNSIQVDAVVDRDTQGVPGSPDIIHTILQKIDDASVCVFDVSIINSATNGRPTPNPNVLIEYGYALKKLGSDRIILIMNTAFGEPRDLPFDLRSKRSASYQVEENADNKPETRKQLEGMLTSALRDIFNQVQRQIVDEPIEHDVPSKELIKVILQNQRPEEAARAREFMKWFVAKLDKIAPDPSSSIAVERDEIFLGAIKESESLISEFASVGRAIAQMDASSASLAIFKSFDEILGRYELPDNFPSGYYDGVRNEVFKFLGHELFTTFIFCLMEEDRWARIAQLLSDRIYVENTNIDQNNLVTFHRLSSHVRVLDYRKNRLNSRRRSLHADLLNERHTTPPFSTAISMQQFMEADLFLFFNSVTQGKWQETWIPRSYLYLQRPPRFLVEMRSRQRALQLAPAFGATTLENLQQRIADLMPRLEEYGGEFGQHALRSFNPQTIGSE